MKFEVAISLLGMVVQLITSLVISTRTAQRVAREEIERAKQKDYRRSSLR